MAAVSPEALNGRIAVELASAGLLPEKVKRAVAIVSGDVEAGEAPSDEDLSDLIEELRDSEPGWFRGSDGDEEKPKGGVHGARRPPKTRTPDPAVRGKEIFDARSARKEFKLPV